MARKPRLKAPFNIYSIVTRVNEKQFRFEDGAVCEEFLKHLKQIKVKLNFKIYGFVIMASHVHLCIQTNDDIADISKVMKAINGGFAIKYNKYFHKKGHFWMERFKSKIIQDFIYLARTVVYFASNPVRAGVTDDPLKYRFCSIQNIYNKELFKEILDELPEEIVHSIKELIAKECKMLVKKCRRIMKQFSFCLKRTRYEQQFRDFIGNTNFRSRNSFVST
jgi:REP element-mobilizing transposase RayT